jgi:hypothetical protein
MLIASFNDELEKLAKKKDHRLLRAAAAGALIGGGLRGLGHLVASPFFYKGLRVKGTSPREAILQTLWRLPYEMGRAAPLGAAAAAGIGMAPSVIQKIKGKEKKE